MRNLPTAHLLELRECLKDTKVTGSIDKYFRAKQQVEIELKLREKLSQLGINKN